MASHKHVLIGVPAYTGSIVLGTVRTIMHETLALTKRGIAVSVLEESGDALLANARARMVARFLASPATHLVCIDSDTMCQPGGLQMLLNADEDFVAALYPKRKDPLSYHVRMMAGDTQSLTEKGLLEVEGVPGGLCCMSRAMLEKMCKHYAAELTYRMDESPTGTAVGLFESYWIDNGPGQPKDKLGEDYAFCKRWRDIGGKIYVVPDIETGHVGLKVWQGRYSDNFEPVAATEEQAA